MLSNVLGTQNAIDVIWTLSYEMAFYRLVTALFVTGKHQRSSRWRCCSRWPRWPSGACCR